MIELFTTPLGLLKVWVVVSYSLAAFCAALLPILIVQKYVALKTGAKPPLCVIDGKYIRATHGWSIFTALAFYWLVLDRIAPPDPWLTAAWLLLPIAYVLKIMLAVATHKFHPLDLPRK